MPRPPHRGGRGGVGLEIRSAGASVGSRPSREAPLHFLYISGPPRYPRYPRAGVGGVASAGNSGGGRGPCCGEHRRGTQPGVGGAEWIAPAPRATPAPGIVVPARHRRRPIGRRGVLA